jgi:hypothetical protein
LFVLVLACVVGHAFDTRDGSIKITKFHRPKAARTIMIGSRRVKNRCTCGKRLKVQVNQCLVEGCTTPFQFEAKRYRD